jgi:Na+-driven multidrug efflux pump
VLFRSGFPALGVTGAAIATIIARIVEMGIMWYYTFYKQKRLDIKPRDLLKGEGWLWRDYARYGLPVGVGDTQWALIGLIKAAFIGRMSQMFVAANGYTSTLLNLGTVFTFALSGGACVVIGKTVGAKQYDKTREYSNTIQIMFFVIGLIMSGFIIAVRNPFIALFSPTDEASALASAMSFIGAITLIGTSYHAACFVGINRGAGDSRFVMWVDMICGWGVVLPSMALAIFVFKWPPEIVFFLTRVDQCYKWIIAFIRLRGDKWIQNVTRDLAPANN